MPVGGSWEYVTCGMEKIMKELRCSQTRRIGLKLKNSFSGSPDLGELISLSSYKAPESACGAAACALSHRPRRGFSCLCYQPHALVIFIEVSWSGSAGLAPVKHPTGSSLIDTTRVNLALWPRPFGGGYECILP